MMGKNQRGKPITLRGAHKVTRTYHSGSCPDWQGDVDNSVAASFTLPLPKEKAPSPFVASDQATSLVETCDEGLMARICEGDKEALASLFRRYARVVRGVAYRVLRDTSEADDMLQDIFLLINRKCGMFDASRGPARFWILQMTYHRALCRRRYLNSRHFYTRVDLDDVGAELATPRSDNSRFEDSGDGVYGKASLQKAFEGLSENQRQTLQLFFVEGYTLGEIAMKLNQTQGNVKHHYFRALEKLRKEIFDSKLRGDSAV
jgi:RNA polymerase sigma-70 factor (ECF subfamily)